MRYASLFLGLILATMLFFQSITIDVYRDTSILDDITAVAGVTGLVMVLIWLLGSALAISFPLVSTILFGITVPLGLLVPTGEFADLRFHGIVAALLTVLSYRGWREKQLQDLEQAEESKRQRKRDQFLEMVLHERYSENQHQRGQIGVMTDGVFCTSCGAQWAPGERFCGECGTPLRHMAGAA